MNSRSFDAIQPNDSASLKESQEMERIFFFIHIWLTRFMDCNDEEKVKCFAWKWEWKQMSFFHHMRHGNQNKHTSTDNDTQHTYTRIPCQRDRIHYVDIRMSIIIVFIVQCKWNGVIIAVSTKKIIWFCVDLMKLQSAVSKSIQQYNLQCRWRSGKLMSNTFFENGQ